MTQPNATIWQALGNITDPEVPVLTILDLGIVRDVEVHQTHADGSPKEVTIIITPTYSGCPAMDLIAMQIRMQLFAQGIETINIENRLYPAWTTDWMSEAGKEKLEAYGIAAPRFRAKDVSEALFEQDAVICPKCKSTHTEMISGFGGTACKALYRCLSCHEPFEYFKCH